MIYDPDGWRDFLYKGRTADWSTPIDREEFYRRFCHSTVDMRFDDMDILRDIYRTWPREVDTI